MTKYRKSWILISFLMWLIIFLSLIIMVSCNNSKRGLRWQPRPDFRVSGWSCHLATNINPMEKILVRESIENHVRAWQPYSKGMPRGWHPSIYVAGPNISVLRGPYFNNVYGYADFTKSEVHVVCGYKLTLPVLMHQLQQLRHGPDLYAQNPLLQWTSILAAQSRVVTLLESRR